MKRSTLYVAVAFCALTIGVLSTWVYQTNYPRFQSEGAWGGQMDGYIVHNFKSSDGEEIALYHKFDSPEETRYLFQSNLSALGSRLIEQGPKLDERGVKVGERAVSVSVSGAARIFWTEGDDFWFIDAPSLSLAQEFERSEMLRTARRYSAIK
jgi:hypothetical protein